MGVGRDSPLEQERAVVTALLLLQLLLWLGFTVHRAPRFAGSLEGTLLGASGAAVMVLPSLAYVAFKRIPGLRMRAGGRASLSRLLAWHVWGGIAGSALAILHTGHRFDSALGLILTATMLVAVFSGYVGRHFLAKVSLELREKQDLLERSMALYNEITSRLAEQPSSVGKPQGPWAVLQGLLGGGRAVPAPEAYALADTATELAGSVADLEESIRTDESLRRRFGAWLRLHIVASIAFYVLLAIHIWASFQFGLRWLV